MYEDDQKCRNQKNLLEEGDVMKFKVVCESGGNDLYKLLGYAKKISLLYKSKADNVDIEWIHQNVQDGMACKYVWDKYYNDFYDLKILSKKKLFETIRDELDMTCKTIRTSKTEIKYCFCKSK